MFEENNLNQEKKFTLNNKNKRKIIIISSIVTISLIIIISLIILLIQKQNPANVLKKSSWQDLTINIDGNTIKMGDKLSILNKYNFKLTDETYKNGVEQNYITGFLPFEYKESNGKYNTILFSAHNKTDKTIPIEECIINKIEFTNDFYKNYIVALPEGILLTEELTIKKIIKKWGKPTYNNDETYEWSENNKLIRIIIKKEGKIVNISYHS